MPSREPFLVNLRGTPQYARYLARLERAVRGEGACIPEGANALAEYALALLGLRHGLVAPARMPKRGRPPKVR